MAGKEDELLFLHVSFGEAIMNLGRKIVERQKIQTFLVSFFCWKQIVAF